MVSPSERVAGLEPVTVVILAKDTAPAKRSTGAVVVVTRDPEIAGTVTGWGVVVVPEEGAVGINRAAAIGRDRAAVERPHCPIVSCR